jgi:hypothetical protein
MSSHMGFLLFPASIRGGMPKAATVKGDSRKGAENYATSRWNRLGDADQHERS